jgi:predicted enzyme related to lactoylglutathione lyase
MSQIFCRYQLQTTDVAAAREFYREVLGPSIWGLEVSAAPLSERARMRGAPPHWLGHIGVDDLPATVERITATGGQQLGPPQPDGDGSPRFVVRDPFGAILALTADRTTPPPGVVVWHVMHARDQDRAFDWYAGHFHWKPTDAVDLGPGQGRHQLFAWDRSGKTAGSISNGASLPHVHPQWLFFFRVNDLAAALDLVQARGGITLGPTATSSGDLVAACDDPQGAAFGLYEVRGR